MDASPESTITKPRDTGDWAGLPHLLCWISGIALLLGAISIFGALADSSNFYSANAASRDWVVAGAFIGSAISTYCIAAVIAALRGIYRNTQQ